MSKDAFWALIQEAKTACGQDLNAMEYYLQEQLVSMGPAAAKNFHDILQTYEDLADQYGLWDAVSVIKEYGCSDDGFIDFRAWLIAQGKEVYMNALRDPDTLADKPLTQNVRLGLDTHKHRRSLNVLVIGGSGAAKTRSYVLPNILEANTNYVITDPKMEVLTATGGYLKSQGYDVRVLNLVNLEQSDGYNPFRYIRDEKDALRLVNNLIQATTPKNSHESDPFWTKAETALLQAIILMLFQEAPESEQNFSMVMRVLEYAEVKEDDEDHVSPLDLLFSAMEREKPDSVAVRQYKVFKMAAGDICSK